MRYVFVIFLLGYFNTYYGQEKLKTIVPAGHYDEIYAVSISHDDRLFATAGKDNSILIWEVRTNRQIRQLSGHDKAVAQVRFSPDDKKILSVGYDGVAKVWDINTGALIATLRDTTDVIRSGVYSDDGSLIITGGHKTNAIVWNSETYELNAYLKADPPTCYQCTPDLDITNDNRYLITGSADRTTMVWDLKKKEVIKKIKLNSGSCSSCNTYHAFNSFNSTIVKADYGGDIFLLNSKDYEVQKKLSNEQDYRKIEVSPNGRFIIALTDYRGKIRVIDISTGKEAFTIEEKQGINDFEVSHDGKFIIAVGDDQLPKMYNSNDGSLKGVYKGIITKIEDENLNSSELYYINQLKDTELSSDGKYVAQCKRGNDVVVWDFNTGRMLHQLRKHNSVVSCIAISKDSKFIATGGADRKIFLWDLTTGEFLKELDGHAGIVLNLSFNQDGSKLISGGWDGYYKIWDISNGEMIHYGSPHKGSPYTTAFTTNGMYALTGGLDRVLLQTEIDSKTTYNEYKGHTDVVQSIDFSEDGSKMLTASWDGSVKIWDPKSSYLEMKFKGHKGRVFDAEFTASGEFVVSGGEDKVIRLWDAKTGIEQRTFVGHSGAVNYLAITPDGKYLLSSGKDGVVKIWDFESGEELISHITLPDNNWIAKNSAGFFEGTPAATKSIFFVKGVKSYALDQFFNQFFKPGVYKEAMSASGKSVRNSGIFGLLEESPPPEIEILAPLDFYEANSNVQEIIIKAKNSGGGIGEVRLTHNAKRVDLPDKLSRTPRAGQDMTLTYTVELIPGINEIEITGVSENGVESLPAKTTVKFEGTPKSAQLYVLAIGINEYANPALTLNYAKSDAEAFAKIIGQSAKTLFDKVHLKVLIDQEGTKENILSAIDEIKNNITKEDVLYVYYAGHGGSFNDEFYFIPTECVSLYQGDKLTDCAISAQLLNSKLTQVSALKQVVILDACHSGASTKALASRGLLEEKALAQLARSTGIHIMAAAGSEQQAVEFGQLGHGVFTYALIEALKGAADGAPNDQKITVYELKSYLDDQVPELSKKYQGSVQYPTTFSLGQDFPVVFIR